MGGGQGDEINDAELDGVTGGGGVNPVYKLPERQKQMLIGFGVDKAVFEKQAGEKPAPNAAMKEQGKVAGGLGGAVPGSIGQHAGSMSQAEQKHQEADKAKDQAQQMQAQQTAEQRQEAQNSVNQMVKQVTDYLKELQGAKAEAMRILTKG